MTDMLAQLSPASWRGISFPVVSADMGFGHDQEKHVFLFRDDKIVEALGRDNRGYSYVIPFREDITRSPWKNLFTEVYPRFLAACLDRSDGILEDPLDGPVQVKCVSLKRTLDAGKRDGVDIVAEFIASPNPEDVAAPAAASKARTLQGTRSDAEALDAAIKKLDWKQEPAPQPTVNPLAALDVAASQLRLAQGKITASLADVAMRAERAEADLEALREPTTEPMRQQARRLRIAALDLADQQEKPTRPVRVYVVPGPIGIIALAGKLRTSVEDLTRMNPQLAGLLEVPQGTRVVYLAS